MNLEPNTRITLIRTGNEVLITGVYGTVVHCIYTYAATPGVRAGEPVSFSRPFLEKQRRLMS